MRALAILALAGFLQSQPAVAALTEDLVEGKPLNYWVEVILKGDMQSADWRQASRVVVSSRQRVVPLLLPLLNDKDVRVRISVLLLLTDLSPLTADVVAAFIRATNDAGTRMVALNGLGRPAASRRGVVPTLMAALKDPSHLNRATAARSLGNLGRDATPAVAALTAALTDEKELVRGAAGEALRKIREE